MVSVNGSAVAVPVGTPPRNVPVEGGSAAGAALRGLGVSGFWPCAAANGAAAQTKSRIRISRTALTQALSRPPPFAQPQGCPEHVEGRRRLDEKVEQAVGRSRTVARFPEDRKPRVLRIVILRSGPPLPIPRSRFVGSVL